MIKNFLTRTFTSLFIFIIFGAIVLSSFYSFVFEVTVGLLCCFCVYESLNALEITKHKSLTAIALVFSFMTPISMAVAKLINKNVYLLPLSIALVFVYVFNVISMKKFENVKYNKASSAMFCTIVITLFLSHIIILRNYFKHGLFYMIMCIVCFAWATDIFAYIVGVCFGKHRFSPNISPKKSLEGSVGGTIICVLFSVLFVYVYCNIKSLSFNLLSVIIFSLLCSLVGQIGDFSFSYIKRSFGIKDFGNVLPGHGGVLDRLDSLIFVAPFMCMLLNFFNIIG